MRASRRNGCLIAGCFLSAAAITVVGCGGPASGPQAGGSPGDGGTQSLRGFPISRQVSIRRAPITDASLEHFKSMKNLKTLNLTSCEQITDEGKQSLKEALPKVDITIF